jgi:hypothetical protein
VIGPKDPDSLDPAELREQATLFERWAAHKRQFADLIEISCFTTMLNADDGTGRRGIDRLLALDPIAGLYDPASPLPPLSTNNAHHFDRLAFGFLPRKWRRASQHADGQSISMQTGRYGSGRSPRCV